MKTGYWIVLIALLCVAFYFIYQSKSSETLYEPVNNDSINIIISGYMKRESLYMDSIHSLTVNVQALQFQKKVLHEKFIAFTLVDATMWLDSFDRSNGIR